MDVWNYINYLQSEQVAIKTKYDKLVSLFGEILEALKNEELKRFETKQKKKQLKCRYYNRGFCKAGEGCSFIHPNDVCQEYTLSGTCSSGRGCWKRHPNKCKYWLRGNCWREDTCAYLHIEETRDDENENVEENDDKKENVVHVDEEDIVDVIDNDEQSTDDHQVVDNVDSTNGITRQLTTDEIIQMYENVEIDLNNSDQISTDDILRMLEIEEANDIEEASDKMCPLKRSTRKPKQRII